MSTLRGVKEIQAYLREHHSLRLGRHQIYRLRQLDADPLPAEIERHTLLSDTALIDIWVRLMDAEGERRVTTRPLDDAVMCPECGLPRGINCDAQS